MTFEHLDRWAGMVAGRVAQMVDAAPRLVATVGHVLTGLLHHHRKSMNIKELRIWTWVNANDCPARSYAQSVAPGAVSSLLRATYVDQKKRT